MKKFTFFIIILFISFLELKAQQKSVVPIMSQSADYIKLIENKYKQQVVHLEFDVIKDEKVFYRQLFAGVMYGIIIYGDEQIKSLNLKIEHPENNEWQTDTVYNKAEGIVMIYFTPKITEYYSFTINSVLKNPDDYGYYGCIIFR